MSKVVIENNREMTQKFIELSQKQKQLDTELESLRSSIGEKAMDMFNKTKSSTIVFESDVGSVKTVIKSQFKIKKDKYKKLGDDAKKNNFKEETTYEVINVDNLAKALKVNYGLTDDQVDVVLNTHFKKKVSIKFVKDDVPEHLMDVVSRYSPSLTILK